MFRKVLGQSAIFFLFPDYEASAWLPFLLWNVTHTFLKLHTSTNRHSTGMIQGAPKHVEMPQLGVMPSISQSFKN